MQPKAGRTDSVIREQSVFGAGLACAVSGCRCSGSCVVLSGCFCNAGRMQQG